MSGDILLNTTDALSPRANVRSSFEFLLYLYPIYNAYNLYVPPVLMVLGTIGNVLSIVILRSENYRRTTTGFYMLALAIADWQYVTNGLIHHYLRRNFGHRIVSKTFCESLLFFLFSGSACSSWTLVLMTIDRTLAVVFPFKAPVLCTKSRAKLSFFIMVVINVLRAIPWLIWGDVVYSRSLDYWTCDLRVDSEELYKGLYNESTAVNQWLPFLLLLIANIQIIITVSRSSAKRREMMGSESAKRGQDTSLTLMLLSNTFAYLLFCLPYQIDFIYWNYFKPKRTLLEKNYRVMSWNVAYLIRFLNPTVNFYAYCLGSSKFRKEVGMLFSRRAKYTQNVRSFKERNG